MAVLAVTYTLANGQTPDATLWNTNYSDIVTWLNNRYNGSDTWSFMKVSSTNANPVDVVSSGSSTELSIDNTATDGDPILTFNLSGSQLYTLGSDDSDSDLFKFGTTSIATNVAMQIPTTGVQVQFADGSTSAPSISFINSTTLGLFRIASGQLGYQAATAHIWYINGTARLDMDNTTLFPDTDNQLSAGKNGFRFVAVWAANGTVQTSVTSTKTNIEDLKPEDIKIPKPIYFNRPEDTHNSQQLGFAADTLPPECFAVVDDNGTRSQTDVYTSSVIGMLCAAVRNDYERFNKIEDRLDTLEAK